MCQNPHQLMTSEILCHFILDKRDELDCKPAMYWWLSYGHKWVHWSGTSPTGLNSGWKMLWNPKPQSSVTPPSVVRSRKRCSCKTQGSWQGARASADPEEPWQPWAGSVHQNREPAGRERQNHPNTSMSTPTGSPRPCSHSPEQTHTPCGPCPCRTGGGVF